MGVSRGGEGPGQSEANREERRSDVYDVYDAALVILLVLGVVSTN